MRQVIIQSPALNSLVPGTARHFAERTASAAHDKNFDAHGFLRPSPRFFTFERLRGRICTLVVAPPWTGKSFTAKRIESDLRASDPQCLFQFTNLEEHPSGGPLEPPWWSDWKRGETRATWLIDAIEEGHRRDVSLCPTLLGLLRDAEKQLQRLRLLIFAREGDLKAVAPQFEPELRRLLGEDFFVVELLSLDAKNAKEVVEEANGSADSWKSVLRLIESNNLAPVAGYPAVLSFLAKSPNTEISVQEVWKGVLQTLLDEPNGWRSQSFREEPECRFDTAARIAAVLTLVGKEEIETSASAGLPTLFEVIPPIKLPYSLATRDAAKETIRSGMFRATFSGHRFLHKNVREWMAAFGMASLRLTKLRPVLQDEPASIEAAATIIAQFNDLAQHLEIVHSADEVKIWIRSGLSPLPSDLFQQNIDGTRRVLDRLEQLANRGALLDWVEDTPSLHHLVVAGFDEELTSRLSDTRRSPPSRRMLLEIGEALEVDEIFDAAVKIIRDHSQDEVLRSWCAAGLRRSGRIDLLKALETFAENCEPRTRVEKEIVSTLFSAFVENGLWTVARAFRFMPRGPASDVIDATRVLPRILEIHMTTNDAEEIVASLDTSTIESLNGSVEERYAKGEISAEPRWEVYSAAARKIALAAVDRVEALRPLMAFALSLGILTVHHENELVPALLKAFQASDTARRELFEAAVEARKTKPESKHEIWSWIHRLLRPEDLGWLEGRLDRLATGAPEVLYVAITLGDMREPTVRQRLREMVGRIDEAALAGYDDACLKREEWDRQEHQRQEAEAAKRRHIADVDGELLTVANLSLQQRLWQLSWANFSGKDFGPRNLVGSWSDVPEDLKREVLDTCAVALDTIAPTPVPDSSSYPAALQYEAQAFVALLSSGRFSLTPERVERWLPAVLKAFQPAKNAILEDCLRLEPGLTERLLLDAIARELRDESAYSILLQDLPQALWTEKVTRWVVDGIEGRQPAEARPKLLELLAARRPEDGVQVAQSMINSRSPGPMARLRDDVPVDGELDALEVQALNVLLARVPEEALPRIERTVLVAGGKFLEKLSCLTSNAREGLRARWTEWQPEGVAALIRILFSAYPPENDPPDESGWVTPADELRWLRWRLVEHLVQSKDQGAPEAIVCISEIHPKVVAIVERIRASQATSDLLTGLERPRSRDLTVAEACRLLDDEYFRLIRNADDLLEVLEEELHRLEKDIGYDHSLLYCPDLEGEAEERRREKALQAYVLRRLQDRLPGKLLLDRELEMQRRGRADIRVTAYPLDAPTPAKVVIEVK
jgi:hypothetical protein